MTTKLLDISERNARSAILGVAATSLSQTFREMVDDIPTSRKLYSFTIKENRTSMNEYLGTKEDYYLDIVKHMFKRFNELREAVWIEGLDSRGKRHVHGVCGARRVPKYKIMNDSFMGIQIYMQRMSQIWREPQSYEMIGFVHRPVKLEWTGNGEHAFVDGLRWITYCTNQQWNNRIYVCLNKKKY